MDLEGLARVKGSVLQSASNDTQAFMLEIMMSSVGWLYRVLVMLASKGILASWSANTPCYRYLNTFHQRLCYIGNSTWTAHNAAPKANLGPWQLFDHFNHK